MVSEVTENYSLERIARGYERLVLDTSVLHPAESQKGRAYHGEVINLLRTHTGAVIHPVTIKEYELYKGHNPLLLTELRRSAWPEDDQLTEYVNGLVGRFRRLAEQYGISSKDHKTSHPDMYVACLAIACGTETETAILTADRNLGKLVVAIRRELLEQRREVHSKVEAFRYTFKTSMFRRVDRESRGRTAPPL